MGLVVDSVGHFGSEGLLHGMGIADLPFDCRLREVLQLFLELWVDALVDGFLHLEHYWWFLGEVNGVFDVIIAACLQIMVKEVFGVWFKVGPTLVPDEIVKRGKRHIFELLGDDVLELVCLKQFLVSVDLGDHLIFDFAGDD